MIEVAIFCDDVVCIGRDSAINELVIILVNVGKKMEVEVGLAVNGLRVAGDGVDHVVRHLGRGLHGEDFLVLAQYLVADAQTITARKEVSPYLVVAALRGQRLDEGIGVEDYVSHVQKGL